MLQDKANKRVQGETGWWTGGLSQDNAEDLWMMGAEHVPPDSAQAWGDQCITFRRCRLHHANALTSMMPLIPINWKPM